MTLREMQKDIVKLIKEHGDQALDWPVYAEGYNRIGSVFEIGVYEDAEEGMRVIVDCEGKCPPK